MSDGKDYEIFVQRLQQALLDSERLTTQKNIKIERHKKITDNCGINREFDLYWEYELAGVTYKTIIECKDYAAPVSVEKIDALIGKIHDIPDLKPVFATKTGYQRGAEKKAKSNKIDLLIVREQRNDDWEDRIREVNFQIRVMGPARITGFKPLLDGKWIKENTTLNLENLPSMLERSDKIFIEDSVADETYSLHDLTRRLNSTPADRYGNFIHKESFEDAYLISKGLRLKLDSYEVEYVRSEPLESPLKIDISKELIGVIEYLHKGSSTAIFKNKIVKDWKRNH